LCIRLQNGSSPRTGNNHTRPPVARILQEGESGRHFPLRYIPHAQLNVQAVRVEALGQVQRLSCRERNVLHHPGLSGTQPGQLRDGHLQQVGGPNWAWLDTSICSLNASWCVCVNRVLQVVVKRAGSTNHNTCNIHLEHALPPPHARTHPPGVGGRCQSTAREAATRIRCAHTCSRHSNKRVASFVIGIGCAIIQAMYVC
jgi:hypothetical protein